MYRSLPKFDATAEFVVARPITLNGETLVAGAKVPATVTPRRLRQLFDTRKVSPVEIPAAAPIAASQKKVVKHGLR